MRRSGFLDRKIIYFSLILLLILFVLYNLCYQVHRVKTFQKEDKVFVDSMIDAGFDFNYSSAPFIKKDIKEVKDAINRELIKRGIFNWSYSVQIIKIDKEGREFAFFNAFCLKGYDLIGSDWNSIAIDILGGGDCYFYGQYSFAGNYINTFNVNETY